MKAEIGFQIWMFKANFYVHLHNGNSRNTIIKMIIYIKQNIKWLLVYSSRAPKQKAI